MNRAGVPPFCSSDVTPRLAALWEVVPLVQSFRPPPHTDCSDIRCAGSFDLPPAPPLLFLFAALAPESHEPGVPEAEPAGGPGCPPLL